MFSTDDYFVQQSRIGWSVLVEGLMEIILILDQWLRRRCHFEIFLIFIWQPSYSRDRKNLSNFRTGHYQEHSYEIILNFDQWDQAPRL